MRLAPKPKTKIKKRKPLSKKGPISRGSKKPSRGRSAYSHGGKAMKKAKPC